MKDLQSFLDEQEKVAQEAFEVTNNSSANWALRKIKQQQNQQKENNSLAETEIEKINSWADSENEKAQRSIDYFQGLLAYYALKQRESDPKFKKLELPNGKIKFTKQQPKFNYDDDVLINYLKKSERTDLIKIKESPDRATVKKTFTLQGEKLVDAETGEFVEGVSIEHREDKFSVDTE